MASGQGAHVQDSKVDHAGVTGAGGPSAEDKSDGERSDGARNTNNSHPPAGKKSKKKKRKKSKKKKGKGNGVAIPDSVAIVDPNMEQPPPDSVYSPTTFSALSEKETNEKQQDIPEHHQRSGGDGGVGHECCGIINEGLVTGGSTTSPAVSEQKLEACDTEGVEPFECCWETINNSFDLSCSKCEKLDDEGASAAEIDEFQGFQEGEPLLLPSEKFPCLFRSAEKSDVRSSTRKVQTHEKSYDTSRTPTLPLHGDRDPDACISTTREVGSVEHYYKRKRSPEGDSLGGSDRTKVDSLGGRFEAGGGRVGNDGLDDDIDDEEESLLLLLLASDADSSSPCAPAPASATIVKESACGSSNNKKAVEPIPPCSPPPAAAEGGLELATWEAEAHGWKGAGAPPRVSSPDLSSPPKPRRSGSNGDECKEPPPAPTHPSIWDAVAEGDQAGVEAKLAAGARIDEADSEGRTPLMIACASGNAAMTSLMAKRLSPPASVAARTAEGWTPLMIAGGGGKLEVVKELIDVGAGLQDRDSAFGSNPLMWACGGGHSEVVRFMLRHGAQELIHSVNFDMWTPLMIACDAGSLETARVLVEAGADLGACNKDGLTALDVAAKRKHPLLMCYLRTEGGFSCSKFWSAAKAGDAPTVSRFLKGNGHLIGALDNDGRTALLLSCVGGHLDVARIFVEAGADVDFQDPSGMSPLSVAAVLGHVPLARYLAHAGGAKLSVRNSAGWTPLMQAVAKGDLAMARYLVDRGAAVNDGSPEGESVLDMARRFADSRLQRYIASKGGFSALDVKRQIGEVESGERGLFRLW